MQFRRRKTVSPRWKHDAWTLATLYAKTFSPVARVLHYIRAGVSVDQVVTSLKIRRNDVENWIRRYNRDGLAILLNITAAVPPHCAGAVERYIVSQPERLRYVLSVTGEELDSLADDIGLELDVLERWILRRLVEES